ncbi:hypothetical protein [Halorhodospira halophila]|uniref:hypothetical protein n=1 Tax=Halorhodospira halophila TaxID=1053 RepID=UPI0019135344|nr:hypothetical protein [Halorhodospira halophila]
MMVAALATVVIERSASTQAIGAAEQLVETLVRENLSEHVLGRAEHAPDGYALWHWMRRANERLTEQSVTSAGAAVSADLRLLRFDGVTESRAADEPWRTTGTVSWEEGGQSHALEWGLRLEHQWAVLAAVFAGVWLASLLAGVGALQILPTPLAPYRQAWLHRLRASGLSTRDAYRLARDAVPDSDLSEEADDFVAEVAEGGDAQRWQNAFAVAAEAQSRELSAIDWQWLQWGMIHFPDDPDYALQLASTSECVELHLEKRALLIRGVPLTLKPVPLCWYALYAHYRLIGEGWIENPRSDRHAATELRDAYLTLAELIQVDARSERAVREGITERDLTRARTRLKDELEAALGDANLAQHYLFEESPTPKGDRRRFRLKLPPVALDISDNPLI